MLNGQYQYQILKGLRLRMKIKLLFLIGAICFLFAGCMNRADFVLDFHEEGLTFQTTDQGNLFFVIRDGEWKLEKWGDMSGALLWSIPLPTKEDM